MANRPPNASTDRPTPVVKWVGGKRQIAGEITPHVSRMLRAAGDTARLVVPFAGGAGLLLTVLPPRVWLNDTNAGLVNMYRQVRDAPEAVVAVLQTMTNTKEEYYRVRGIQRDRAGWPATPEGAAHFLYLNRTTFRGLYRENRAGQFNVPYGNYKTDAYRTDAFFANVRALSAYLRAAAPGDSDITCADFRSVLGHVRPGDVVYADPPYYPLKKGQFVGYSRSPFTPDDHVALNRLLRGCGAPFVLSNSPADAVRGFWDPHADCLVRAFHVNRRVTVYRKQKDGTTAPPPPAPPNELLVIHPRPPSIN